MEDTLHVTGHRIRELGGPDVEIIYYTEEGINAFQQRTSRPRPWPNGTKLRKVIPSDRRVGWYWWEPIN